MFYRRKILLALLDQFGGRLDKISLQKFLFLFTRQQGKKSFHFIPYRFGCFSFQANADLKTLAIYGLTKETEDYWEKYDNTDFINELKPKDKAAIRFVKSNYGMLNKEDLIRLTYREFPFFALNSTIAPNVITSEELKTVKNQRIIKNKTILFTIGYEGISIEEYINKLIVNDVRVLCDVRKNPLSMKFGFSKKQLQQVCNGVGIEYNHFPELGIESNKRRQLKTQEDYGKLFAYYKKVILKNESNKQNELLSLLKSKKRIALTCFEANIYQCHRKHLAESIAQIDGVNYEIKHI